MAVTYTTGKDCDSWCGKCKLELAHTIVAMVDGIPVQVKCNTCNAFHRFRAPKGTAGATRRRTSSASGSSRTMTGSKSTADSSLGLTPAMAAEVWKQKVEPRLGRGDIVRPYDVRAAFTIGELLKHNKFGVGHVAAVVGPTKIKVVFETAERVLIANYGK